jgi:rubrerythrin
MADFESIDDILDFAIAREIQAHDFYVYLAGRVTVPEVRMVIQQFAVEELQHRVRLEAIKAGDTAFADDEVGSLGIADRIPDVQPHADMTYAELLIVAMNREKTAFLIYTHLASLARMNESRETLLRLAQEEAQHKLRLEIEYDLATF